MKKLMIAAAAAAMIGGVNASEFVYDFSASLKTTSAKSSSSSKTEQYSFGFAKNTNNEYWYTDESIVRNGNYLDWVARDDNGDLWEVVRVATINSQNKSTIQPNSFKNNLYLNGLKVDKPSDLLVAAAKLTFVASIAQYGGIVKAPADFIVNYGANFTGVQDVYKNKKQWCMTINWNEKITSTACYRVAGSVKLAGRYTMTGCCEATWDAWDASYQDYSKKGYPEYTGVKPTLLVDDDNYIAGYDMDIYPTFIYYFGGLFADKSTKVEMVADIGDWSTYQLPLFKLAGQGTRSMTLKDRLNQKVADYDGFGISSISGNIVGVWLDPECQVCCGNDNDALVFDCDETPSKDITVFGARNEAEAVWSRGWVDASYVKPEPDNLWGTAAWGTFTLKYNQKNSLFYHN